MNLENRAKKFWTWERIHRFSWALFFSLIIALVSAYRLDKEEESALKRGDFPGFYSPSVIVARGLGERLYDLELQRSVQNEFWPSMKTEFYISVYPAFYAFVISPLGHLDHLSARNLFTTLSVLSYFATIFFITKLNPALTRYRMFIAVTFLLALPVFYGVLSGQNTAFSMLIYILALYFLSKNLKSTDIFAGCLMGLWLFKPQFGVMAGFYLFLSGRFYAVASYLCVAVMSYILGVFVLGPLWPIAWVNAATYFGELNYVANGHQMVSMMGFWKVLSRLLNCTETCQALVIGIGWILTFLFFLLSIRVFLRTHRYLKTSSVTQNSEAQIWFYVFCLIGPAVILISPQTLFYDLGIGLASFLCLLRLDSDRDINRYLLLVLICSVLTASREISPLPLVVCISITLFAFVYRRIMGLFQTNRNIAVTHLSI